MSDTALVPKEDAERFDAREKDVAKRVYALTFEREEDLQIASAFTDMINAEIKTITNYFEPRKQRANKVWKDWVGAEKDACAPWEKLKAHIKTERETLFRKLKEEADLKAAELKQQAEERGIPEEAVASPTFAAPKMRKTYTYEIIDPAAVPREYLMIDTSKLQRLATESKATAVVAGVKFSVREIAV